MYRWKIQGLYKIQNNTLEECISDRVCPVGDFHYLQLLTGRPLPIEHPTATEKDYCHYNS